MEVSKRESGYKTHAACMRGRECASTTHSADLERHPADHVEALRDGLASRADDDGLALSL